MAGSTFVCEVCCEDSAVGQRCSLGVLDVGNNNRVRQADCGHPICNTCMAKYIESRINESRVWNLKCPHDGCSADVREQDVKKLVDSGRLGPEMLERFVNLRNCDQKERASELASTIGELIQSWSGGDSLDALLQLYNSTRLCPRCSMILEKSAGCNSFYCSCGFHFNFHDAPRIVGAGMKAKDFQRTVLMANKRSMTLAEAETYKGDAKDWGRALRMSEMSELPLREARELCNRAKDGDEEAREAIRAARRHRRRAKELEEKEEEEVCKAECILWT
mmetsp:Transcript_53368/g.98691  ORF Transcript_53368/g.98691 Transcript_53368/m.98691 type:complete len:277 (-) Transcript_53368:122-952(-)